MRSQKNWNLIRRLTNNTNQLSVLLFCFLLSACDKQERLYNRWNLQYVTMNGVEIKDTSQYNVIPYYTTYSFLYENRLNIYTYARGVFVETADGFYQRKKNSMLNMSFTIMNKKYDIKAKVKKLTKKEMHLEYTDKGNKYFLKLYTN